MSIKILQTLVRRDSSQLHVLLAAKKAPENYVRNFVERFHPQISKMLHVIDYDLDPKGNVTVYLTKPLENISPETRAEMPSRLGGSSFFCVPYGGYIVTYKYDEAVVDARMKVLNPPGVTQI